MSALRKLSLRGKLIGIIAIATILPFAAGFTAVIFSDIRALKQELVETALLVARVTAENSASDLAFTDRDASQKTLSKLASIPSIRWAAVFDTSGRLFGTYVARGRKLPQDVAVADSIRSFELDELRVSEPIVYGADRYGTIVMSMSTGGLATKVRDHSLVLLVVLIACAIAAILLARRLEAIVSKPILDLTALAREISERHDYSLRVPHASEDEVGVLAAGFNEMLTQIERRQRERDEADQRTREKSQFLANMSHELRTPLNAIIGFSEVLRGRLDGKMDPREARFLENINSSGQHLLGIVNDILDLSKIEAGKMEVSPERFSLRSAVEGVCSLMRGVSSRRKVTFDLDLDDSLPIIEADPVKVKQILYNLLSNAVKFSPDGSTVIIRTRALGAYAVRMSVIDHGIGIDKSDHERIFQEFQQVDSTLSRQFEGTGLGLTLVKKFIEMHGGAIEIESALGEGSRFTVTLPLRFRGVGLAIAQLPSKELVTQ